MEGAKGLFFYGFAMSLSEIGLPFDAVGDVSWNGMYVDTRESNHGMTALFHSKTVAMEALVLFP